MTTYLDTRIDEDFESTFGSIGPLDPLELLTLHLLEIRTLRAWLLPLIIFRLLQKDGKKVMSVIGYLSYFLPSC